jgi:hypothetical protein
MRNNLLFCLSSGYSLELWERSGIISREIEILRKLSQDFNIILFSYGSQSIEEQIAVKYNLTIKVYGINCNSRWQILYSLFHAIILGLSYRFSVVRTVQFSGSWVGLIVAQLNNSFYTIRTGYNFRTHVVEKSNNKFIKSLYLQFERMNLKRSNLIICTAREQMNYYKSIEPSIKVLISHNHVNLDLFKPEKTEIDKQYDFMIVSKFTPQKNLINTINYLSRFERSTLLVGRGNDPNLNNEIKHLVDNYSEWLHYIPVVPNHLLPSFFHKSKIFVNFSLYEGNPKAVIEAYCSGMALLLSDIESQQELKRIFGNNAILCPLENDRITMDCDFDYLEKFYLKSRKEKPSLSAFDLNELYLKEINVYKQLLIC